MASNKVKPLLAGGFRDYLPALQIQRAAIIRRVQAVYERFGFDPLETPAVERLSVLTGGDESDKFLYRTFPARGGRWLRHEPDQKVSLRFDLTVPLARVVAANDKLPRPFKRYQVGSVWRGEKPQLGRYREFLQFDADIVGASTMMADAEMITIMNTVMTELGFERYTIRVNDRKVLNGLADAINATAGTDAPPLGGDDDIQALIRVLDKIDNLGVDAVLDELRLPREADDPKAPTGLALGDDAIALIRRYLQIAGTHDQVLDALGEVVGETASGREGVDELREIVGLVREGGVPDDRWRLDPTIARGLDYYTGPIWEVVLDDLREIGTVYSGGRYDRLVGRFVADAAVPCTGISVGVDRLFAGMETLGMLESAGTVTEVLLVNFAPELASDYTRMAARLRAAGVNTALYLGEDTSFKAQISYAARQEIPVVVILGPDDKARGMAQVKDMRARTQTEVAIDAVPEAVAGLLGRSAGEPAGRS